MQILINAEYIFVKSVNQTDQKFETVGFISTESFLSGKNHFSYEKNYAINVSQ